MANNSHIEWTEATWNPITGCTKISPGCKNCYANRMAMRLKAIGQPNYRNGFELTLHEQMLSMPSKWSKSRTIFVNSMSDLFHQDVPRTFIHRVFSAMHQANWHQYQILTKRSDRLLSLNADIAWAPHIWMGVSVENEDYTLRIDHLRRTGAHLKFLSLEPLLGPLPELDFSGIDWVIVGGESGPRARPIEATWVRDIRDQCLNQDVPFFFKQWGGVFKKRNGRLLDGRTWDQMPMVSPSLNQLRRQPNAPLADCSGAGYLRKA
jgi:protein gp37